MERKVVEGKIDFTRDGEKVTIIRPTKEFVGRPDTNVDCVYFVTHIYIPATNVAQRNLQTTVGLLADMGYRSAIRASDGMRVTVKQAVVDHLNEYTFEKETNSNS